MAAKQRTFLNCDCNKPNCPLDGSCFNANNSRKQPDQNCFSCNRPITNQKWIVHGQRLFHISCDRPVYALLDQLPEAEVLEKLTKLPEKQTPKKEACCICATTDYLCEDWIRAAEKFYCKRCYFTANPPKNCSKCGRPNEASGSDLKLVRSRFCVDCATCCACLRTISTDHYSQIWDKLFCNDCKCYYDVLKYDLQTMGGINGERWRGNDDYVYEVNLRSIVPVKFGTGPVLRALIDIGATRTIVNKPVLSADADIRKPTHADQLRGATGREVGMVGRTNINFTLGGADVEIEAVVWNRPRYPYDIVVGMDVLSRFDLIIARFPNGPASVYFEFIGYDPESQREVRTIDLKFSLNDRITLTGKLDTGAFATFANHSKLAPLLSRDDMKLAPANNKQFPMVDAGGREFPPHGLIDLTISACDEATRATCEIYVTEMAPEMIVGLDYMCQFEAVVFKMDVIEYEHKYPTAVNKGVLFLRSAAAVNAPEDHHITILLEPTGKFNANGNLTACIEHDTDLPVLYKINADLDDGVEVTPQIGVVSPGSSEQLKVTLNGERTESDQDEYEVGVKTMKINNSYFGLPADKLQTLWNEQMGLQGKGIITTTFKVAGALHALQSLPRATDEGAQHSGLVFAEAGGKFNDSGFVRFSIHNGSFPASIFKITAGAEIEVLPSPMGLIDPCSHTRLKARIVPDATAQPNRNEYDLLIETAQTKKCFGRNHENADELREIWKNGLANGPIQKTHLKLFGAN